MATEVMATTESDFPATETVVPSNNNDVKLFNRWTFDDVNINDISLSDYVGVQPGKHATYVPHTAGRYSVKRFRKAQCPIVERLTNSLMMHGRNNGKKLMAVRIIKHTMEIIHLLTDQNPIQVIVDAVVNSGPREDATRIGSAGVVRRQAVDISPLRRVNQAIYLLTTGARESAFRNIKTIAECLADELINAAKGSSNRKFGLRFACKMLAFQLYTTLVIIDCGFVKRFVRWDSTFKAEIVHYSATMQCRALDLASLVTSTSFSSLGRKIMQEY
ncbi:hypothetical protein ACFE04_020632 [Oxalis oulophora]